MKKTDLINYSTDKLKELARELFSVICISECFSISDLTLYDWVLQELYNRGIVVDEDKKLNFSEIGE